jgi:hypothetical protein
MSLAHWIIAIVGYALALLFCAAAANQLYVAGHTSDADQGRAEIRAFWKSIAGIIAAASLTRLILWMLP